MLLKNVREEKRRVRKRYKKLRRECPPDVKAKLDNGLTERLLDMEEYKDAQRLFIFVSSPIECDTSRIISDALQRGKQVAVPRCTEKTGIMHFYFISSMGDLSPGAFSLLEPDPQKCEPVKDLSNGLCVVPGLCFDLEGYRLGFGKGYYDRFLDYFGGVTVGICYSKYIEKQLPRGAHDRHTDILVTERFINRNL